GWRAACRSRRPPSPSPSQRHRNAAPAGPYWPSAREQQWSWSDLHRYGLLERASHHTPAERDLERVVPPAPGVGGGRLRGTLREAIVEPLTFHQRFRLAGTPRHCGDAAERDARVTNHAVLHIERDRSRRQRELVGLAVARLQVH